MQVSEVTNSQIHINGGQNNSTLRNPKEIIYTNGKNMIFIASAEKQGTTIGLPKSLNF